MAGAAIGIAVEDPFLSFAAGFGAHFLMDMFLHWNFSFERHRPMKLLIALDLGAGLLLAWALLGYSVFLPAVVAGMAGCLLPDIWTSGRKVMKRKLDRFDRFHNRIQNETDSPLLGLPTQAAVVLLSALLILFG